MNGENDVQLRHAHPSANSKCSSAQLNIELPTSCANRFGLSTESLLNIDDNFKLLMNLHRTRSCSNSAPAPGPGQTPAQHTATTEQVLQAQEELLEIICKYLLWKNELKNTDSSVVHEWRMLALYIDRILFWIFFTIITSSSLMFLVIIPIQQRGFPYFFGGGSSSKG